MKSCIKYEILKDREREGQKEAESERMRETPDIRYNIR